MAHPPLSIPNLPISKYYKINLKKSQITSLTSRAAAKPSDIRQQCSIIPPSNLKNT